MGFYESHMYKSATETWIKFRRKFLAVFEFPSESLCGLLSEKLSNIRAHLDHKPCKPRYPSWHLMRLLGVSAQWVRYRAVPRSRMRSVQNVNRAHTDENSYTDRSKYYDLF